MEYIDKKVEEFMNLTEDCEVEGDGLYGEGSHTEWLENNKDKHLFSTEVYGEPMCDIDAYRVADWLHTALQEAYDKGREDERGKIEK